MPCCPRWRQLSAIVEHRQLPATAAVAEAVGAKLRERDARCERKNCSSGASLIGMQRHHLASLRAELNGVQRLDGLGQQLAATLQAALCMRLVVG